MQPLTPIKNIAFEGINSDNPLKWRKCLQDILFYIAKEEENFKLRLQYYNELKKN